MVHYVDQQGNSLAPSQTLTGNVGETYTAKAASVAGYHVEQEPANATGSFNETAQTVTFSYAPDATAVIQAPFTTGSHLVGLKKLGLYRQPTFTTTGRITWYAQQPRTRQPEFVVLGPALSKQGQLRYRVRDVNRGSRTFGQTGYITGRKAYVQAAYETRLPQSKKLTVINPHGIVSYRHVTLTGRVKALRQGTVLRVMKVVQNQQLVRYQLTNGNYVTANKRFVQLGRVTMPKQVTTKHVINRYRDVNFKLRQGHFAAKRTLKVRGWDYSTHGTLRYRVSGGYITANRQFLK